MLVHKDVRTPADANVVNLDEDWEVEYWCERFDVNEATLRACVMQVGPAASDVERKLRIAARESFKNDGES